MNFFWKLFLNPTYRKLCFTILTAVFLTWDFILLAYVHQKQSLLHCSRRLSSFSYSDNSSDRIYTYSKVGCYVIENCTYSNTNMNDKLPSLTLFTSFEYQEEKYYINKNTLRNWKAIEGKVNLVLFTNSSKVTQMGVKAGWHVLPIPQTGSNGSPVVASMFKTVVKLFNTSFYGLANGDILFDTDLVNTLSSVSEYSNSSRLSKSPTLIIGQRTNVNTRDFNMTTSDIWRKIIYNSYMITEKFLADAMDYFIVKKDFPWKDIPDFVLGRRGYDNWIVAFARYKKFMVVDASATILAIHQTSVFGNYEGFLREIDDKDHNMNIIKLQKFPNFIHWGRTDCCHYRTSYKCGQVVIETRTNVPRFCNWLKHKK